MSELEDPNFDLSSQTMQTWRSAPQFVRFSDGEKRLIRTGDQLLLRKTGEEDYIILAKITIQ